MLRAPLARSHAAAPAAARARLGSAALLRAGPSRRPRATQREVAPGARSAQSPSPEGSSRAPMEGPPALRLRSHRRARRDGAAAALRRRRRRRERRGSGRALRRRHRCRLQRFGPRHRRHARKLRRQRHCNARLSAGRRGALAAAGARCAAAAVRLCGLRRLRIGLRRRRLRRRRRLLQPRQRRRQRQRARSRRFLCLCLWGHWRRRCGGLAPLARRFPRAGRRGHRGAPGGGRRSCRRSAALWCRGGDASAAPLPLAACARARGVVPGACRPTRDDVAAAARRQAAPPACLARADAAGSCPLPRQAEPAVRAAAGLPPAAPDGDEVDDGAEEVRLRRTREAPGASSNALPAGNN